MDAQPVPERPSAMAIGRTRRRRASVAAVRAAADAEVGQGSPAPAGARQVDALDDRRRRARLEALDERLERRAIADGEAADRSVGLVGDPAVRPRAIASRCAK